MYNQKCRHKSFRGRDFKYQDLTRKDFSCSDIRGANFSYANLGNANFSCTIAGLCPGWICFCATILCALATLSGLIFLTLSIIASHLLNSVRDKEYNILTGAVVLAMILILILIILIAIRRKSLNALGAIAVCIGISSIVSLASRWAIGAVVGEIIATVLSSIGLVCTALAIAGVTILFGDVAGVLGVVFILIVYTIGAVFFSIHIATVLSALLSLLGGYLGHSSLSRDSKLLLLRNIAIAITSFGGTNFYGANLTDANFNESTLKGTIFNKAKLIRTNWLDTKFIEFARVGESYLRFSKIRQLVVNGRGKNLVLNGLNLDGINLMNADLREASFVGTSINHSNFQNTNLSKAKLKQAQLDGADLTGAILTGAFIEDWGITSNTKLDGIRCEYVYMRVPTEEDRYPVRKPDNRHEVFKDGDFADFIRPLIGTLDLYHNQGVDPRAIAIAFKDLAESHPEAELEIVAMEKKGEDNFLLRAKTAPTANKSELSAEYFENYNQLKALTNKQQAIIIEKDSRIRSLENFVELALKKPSFYAETYHNQGNTMSEEYKTKFDMTNAKISNVADTVHGNQQSIQHNYAQENKPNNTVVKTILILASNPQNTAHLRLDKEVREIEAGLQRAKKRELFDLKQRWAVRVKDVSQALLNFKPNFVHFCGHGTGEDGLAFEDDNGNFRLVETDALAKLFELFSNSIECVVLNACYSEVQAEVIVKHIPYVIGMNKAIGDQAAIKFATGFYSALGTGETVDFAYKFGRDVIILEGIEEHLTPVLKIRGSNI